MFVSALAALFISGVEGHGYISNPRARSIGGKHWPPGSLHPYNTEPQSAGAVGAPAPIPVCGRDDSGAIERRADDPVGVITPGESFDFTADITAHHMGHMTVRICPYIDQTFTVSQLSECVTVEGADGQGPFWWLSPNSGIKTWTGTIPTLANLPTTSVDGAYTVQWRWNTANSCCPHKGAYQAKGLNNEWCHGECRVGWSSAYSATDLYDGTSGEGSCSETNCCSEVFTNCADVKLAGSSPTWPAVQAAPTAPPTAAPVPEPEPEAGSTPGTTAAPTPGTTVAPIPEPEPEPAPTGDEPPCVHNTDCGTSAWCAQTDVYGGPNGHCAAHNDGVCPTPHCTRHPQPALVQVSPHFTKFSGKIQEDVGRIRHAVAANGEIADISDDDA